MRRSQHDQHLGCVEQLASAGATTSVAASIRARLGPIVKQISLAVQVTRVPQAGSLGSIDMGSPLPRVAAVALLALSLHSADGKKKRRKKAAPVVECGGKEPTTDGFEVRVLESVDADVCDRRSRVGDTLTVKFASRYFDTCETFAENKGEEFAVSYTHLTLPTILLV